MPRQETILTVFLASPEDVLEERATLEDIIRELNDTWSRTLGVRLGLVRWETHVHPAIGTDPQEAINRQLPDDYDVFIGIMWSRFGTPTGRAGSGTAEEYERAYSRHQTSPGSVEIMFYFKDQPIAPSMLDADQLSAVNTFRRRLGTEGALYRFFRDVDDFQRLVRIHLSQLAQEWTRRQSAAPAPHQVENPPAGTVTEDSQSLAVASEETELGIIDLIDQSESELRVATDSLSRLTEALSLVGNSLSKRTVAINRSKDQRNPRHMQVVKREANKAASNMLTFVTSASAEVPVFSASLRRSIDLFGQAISNFTTDVGPTAAPSLAGALVGVARLREKMNGSYAQLGDLRRVVSTTPRMTSDLIRAKREMSRTLEAIQTEVASSVSLCDEVNGRMLAILQQITAVEDPSPDGA
jgi:hypothetical protein